MNYTQNLRLPQWEGSDRIHHDDFNEAFGKIDAAVSGKVNMLAGTYTGNGAASRTINLGFTPKVVIVWQNGAIQYNSYYYGGAALEGTSFPGVSLAENGFTIYKNNAAMTNVNDLTYAYLAFY